MSAQVAIVCDQCGDIGDVGATAQEIRPRLNGWTWRNGLDICPLCTVVSELRQTSTRRRPSSADSSSSFSSSDVGPGPSDWA